MCVCVCACVCAYIPLLYSMLSVLSVHVRRSAYTSIRVNLAVCLIPSLCLLMSLLRPSYIVHSCTKQTNPAYRTSTGTSWQAAAVTPRNWATPPRTGSLIGLGARSCSLPSYPSLCPSLRTSASTYTALRTFSTALTPTGTRILWKVLLNRWCWYCDGAEAHVW